MKKTPRWLIPLLLAAVGGWLVSRPSGPSFVRLPSGPSYPAPPWTMTDLDGRSVSSTNYAGQVVVLNFWATWCPPCVRELPELREFHTEHSARGLVVIGASVDEGDVEKIRSFATRYRLPYPVLRADPVLQETYAVGSLPTTVIINRQGQVVARYLGALTREELVKATEPWMTPLTPVSPAPPASGTAGGD